MMLYTVKPTGTVCERWEYESEHVGGDSERFIFQAMLQQLPEHSVARVQINNLH